MKIKGNFQIVFIFLTLFFSNSAFSHDIWLSPEQSSQSHGYILTVHQLVGTELNTEMELPFLRRVTSRFELLTSDESINLLSEIPNEKTAPSLKPVLTRKVDFEGLALLSMEHNYIYTEFSQEEFIHYLKHEEFEIEEFQDFIRSKQNHRERYKRSIKCLIKIGTEGQGKMHNRILGQKIEIVLLQNPYMLSLGDNLAVKILFDGKPLQNKHIVALNKDKKQSVLKVTKRTNRKGIAHFKLTRKGFWLIRLVNLLPCSDQSDVDCSQVDWESYWGSYSFKLD